MAPDFIGFGRSDKYTEIEDYSFKLHFQTIESFIEKLDLREITLVCHDWGGLIGLTVAAQHPERFARLVIMNTGLPTGEEKMPEGFMAESSTPPSGGSPPAKDEVELLEILRLLIKSKKARTTADLLKYVAESTQGFTWTLAGLKALPDMPLTRLLNDKGKAIEPYTPAPK